MTFPELVEQHYKSLYYFALSLTRDPSDAEDLVQQSFLKMAKNLRKVRDMEKGKSWLSSCLYRLFIDQRRRKQRFPEVEFDEAFEGSGSASFGEQNAQTQLDAQTLVEKMQELPESLRIPLSLFYFEDHSYQQIAEILSLPIGTVMSRLFRAKTALHRLVTTTDKTSKENHQKG